MNIKRILGENIKKYRKMVGLTQDQLAEKLEVGPKHLSNIEIGRKFVTAELLEKLSSILKVSPSSLFYTTTSSRNDDTLQRKIEKAIDDHFTSTAKSLKETIKDI